MRKAIKRSWRLTVLLWLRWAMLLILLVAFLPVLIVIWIKDQGYLD